METFNFTHPDNGNEGNIEYDNKTLKFWYTLESGNKRYFERVRFSEEDNLQEYKSTFATYLVDSLGNEIEGTRRLVYYTVPSSEVQAYQNTELANIPSGIKYIDFTRKSTVNGLIARLEDFGCTTNNNMLVSNGDGDGYRPFDQSTLELITP